MFELRFYRSCQLHPEGYLVFDKELGSLDYPVVPQVKDTFRLENIHVSVYRVHHESRATRDGRYICYLEVIPL